LPGGATLNLERRLTYRFSILSSVVMRSVADMYGAKYRLRPSSWKAMAAIGRYGPVSAKEVCGYTTVAPDKVTRAVDRLVKMGYVERKQDVIDRRRVALSLSRSGRAAYGEIERVTREVELALLNQLSRDERKRLHTALAKLETRAAELLTDRQAWRRIAGTKSARKTTTKRSG
jgi:DNA-binding MarR family transcriptional regulator